MRREKQEERENTKEHFSLLRTNKQETFSSEKEPVQTEPNQKQHVFSEKEYVTGEKTKGEKNDDQTEQSPQKKRYMKMEATEEKHSRTRTKKKHVQKLMRINQKGKVDQKKKDKHAKYKYEKVHNKKRDGQTFFEFVEVP